MAPIEKFFAKHSPTMLRSILEPVCTLLIMVPLAYCLLAPAGAFLGNYISSAVIWLYNTLGFVGVAVLAAVMPFLIMTGMHSAFVPYLLQMFATVGYEPIFFTALVISNPSRGIDIGATEFIHEAIMEKRNNGCAILLSSADLDEIFRLSDRIITMYEGEITGHFKAGEITKEEIGYYMTGSRRKEADKVDAS